VAGLGYRDVGFENQITYVELAVNVTSTNNTLDTEPQPFDMFVIGTGEDYDCYIQATQSFGSGEASCNFLMDPGASFFNVTSFTYNDTQFMLLNESYREFLLIIDNSNFPYPSNTTKNDIEVTLNF